MGNDRKGTHEYCHEAHVHSTRALAGLQRRVSSIPDLARGSEFPKERIPPWSARPTSQPPATQRYPLAGQIVVYLGPFIRSCTYS